jgi:hypothetical protein
VTDLEVIACVAYAVMVVCVLAAYAWTVLTKDDDGVPPVFHRPNASHKPTQDLRTNVAAPPSGDVDRARRDPSGADLSLFGNQDQVREVRERANMLEPASRD